MPSVTTVLGQKKMQYLEDLRDKIGEEALNKISQNAALRGTAMHKYLENYLIALKVHADHDKALLYTQKKTVTLRFSSIRSILFSSQMSETLRLRLY